MQSTNLNPHDRRRSIVLSCLLAILFLVLSANALTQESENDEQMPGTLFSSSDTLEVTLTLPWQTIVRDEFFFQGAYPARIDFTDDLGNVNSLEITAERRGMTRQVVCHYPPIKLRFEKEAVKRSDLRYPQRLRRLGPR